MAIKGWISLALLCTLGALLLTSAPASARGIVAKDGKIHACYKAKGKGKGTLRVVRNAKVKCPKKWKKTAWYAQVPVGPPPVAGPAGPPGPQGERGLQGTAGNLVVEGLEDKVTELLKKVESLEALIPTVTALCTQASVLTTQVNSLEEALGGLKLNTVLTALGGLLEFPTLPGALPSFSCP